MKQKHWERLGAGSGWLAAILTAGSPESLYWQSTCLFEGLFRKVQRWASPSPSGWGIQWAELVPTHSCSCSSYGWPGWRVAWGWFMQTPRTKHTSSGWKPAALNTLHWVLVWSLPECSLISHYFSLMSLKHTKTSFSHQSGKLTEEE